MFEQSTLTSASASKRFWATTAGAMGECVLLLFAIAAPLIWPDVLPRTNLITSWLPPVPRGQSKPPEDKPRVPRVRTTEMAYRSGAFFSPLEVPTVFPRTVDEPGPPDPDPWIPGGIPNGVPGAPNGSLLDGIMRSAAAPAPRTAEPPPAAPAAAPAAAPPRVRLGGRVKMAEIVRRVEPQYPAMAKQMRVQGEVQLVAVIGIDGRIKELRVANGHPLLARAALDAVSQWIYRPTRLNDEPVEVIAPITVAFHLN